MRINGYLSEGDVYTILRILGRTCSSGLLRLHTVDREATLAVHHGCVVRASIGSGVFLGQALVMRGAIEPDAIEEALLLQQRTRPRRRVGTILVGLGVVEKGSVGEALAEGIRDVIENTADWSAGSYEFESTNGVEGDGVFGGVPIDDLVPAHESPRCVPEGH